MSEMPGRLNKGFNIERGELNRRLEYQTQIPPGYFVVPLKGIEKAEDIVVMPDKEMEAFLRHIPLIESPDIFPYKDARFFQHRTSTKGLVTPQRFIQESKIISILKGLGENGPLYKGFGFAGLSHRHAHYVFGKDEQGRDVCGVYFPPLIEVIGENALLFDGNHRTLICCESGGTTESVLIKGSSVKPPYGSIPWHTTYVTEKPPIKERYVDLVPALFKNFDWVGIDG